MRTFAINKISNLMMSKKQKLELYRRDVDAGQGVAKLFANKENWLTVKSTLNEFHDEAVKKMSQRRLSPDDLEWVNQRISLIAEILKKFYSINEKGVIAHQKLKEMKND